MSELLKKKNKTTFNLLYIGRWHKTANIIHHKKKSSCKTEVQTITVMTFHDFFFFQVHSISLLKGIIYCVFTIM